MLEKKLTFKEKNNKSSINSDDDNNKQKQWLLSRVHFKKATLGLERWIHG